MSIDKEITTLDGAVRWGELNKEEKLMVNVEAIDNGYVLKGMWRPSYDSFKKYAASVEEAAEVLKSLDWTRVAKD